MFQNKWFNWVNIVIGLSLAVVAVLTIRSGLATVALASSENTGRMCAIRVAGWNVTW